jgi:hypothetical protein
MTTLQSTKLAYHLPTQMVIHIDKAENGLACNCECTECKERLEAVQGQIREWYFRHDSNTKCRGGQETALHQLGKQILVENNQIAIPEKGLINYSSPIAEKGFYSTRPDVTAIYNEKKIYFEIAVSHFVEKEKEAFFTDGQHKCVEIDLSDADATSYDHIKNLVLFETTNKKLFGWDRSNTVETNDGGIFKFAFGAFLLFILYQIFGRQKKR